MVLYTGIVCVLHWREAQSGTKNTVHCWHWLEVHLYRCTSMLKMFGFNMQICLRGEECSCSKKGIPRFTISLVWIPMWIPKKNNCCFFSWMGRTIIERPLKEIAEFLKDPTSALIYDKHITVGLSLNSSHYFCMYPSTLHLLSLYSAIKTYQSSVSIWDTQRHHWWVMYDYQW